MNWISALADLQQRAEASVLVTIIEERGSTPRNAGSKMVVSAEKAYDTIGGGHLEFKAMAIAREMLLAREREPKLERFSLGASLGQCCGGATVLLFEPMGQPQAHIAVFGAGHVGRALAPLLAGLPLRLEWVDSRAAEFPRAVPEGVRTRLLEEPEDAVHEAPPGSYFLIMTHNHPLDYAIAEAVLKRGDAGFLGMIGSRTKARRFQMRLEQQGYPQDVIAQMHCPIGLSEVPGKRPLEVAVSVAAQVIARYHQDAPARQTRDGVEWEALSTHGTCSEGSCDESSPRAKT